MLLKNKIHVITVSALLAIFSGLGVSFALQAEEAIVPQDLIYIVEEDTSGNAAVFGGGVV